MFAVPIGSTRVGVGGQHCCRECLAWGQGIASILTGEDGWEAPASQSAGQEGQEGQVQAPTQPGQVRQWGHAVHNGAGRGIGAGAGPQSAQAPPSWPSASPPPSSAQPTPAWMQGRRGHDHLRSGCFSLSSRTCWIEVHLANLDLGGLSGDSPSNLEGFLIFTPGGPLHGPGGSPEPLSLGLMHLVLL